MTQEQSKMIDLEQIMHDSWANPLNTTNEKVCIYCMREAIRQALELAAEKAELESIGTGRSHEYVVNKQSITSVNELVKLRKNKYPFWVRLITLPAFPIVLILWVCIFLFSDRYFGKVLIETGKNFYDEA